MARVRIDGVTVAIVDLYAPEPQPRTIAWSGTLSPGGHTLAIVVTGDRNPASSGTRVALDALLELP